MTTLAHGGTRPSFLESAKAKIEDLRSVAHGGATALATYEIASEQRYRTMAGMDEPLADRAARARANAAKIQPLSRKTW